MKKWPIVVGISSVATAALAAVAGYELKTLKSTYYDIHSDKIKGGDDVKAVLLTDLHERNYGDDNVTLIRRVKKASPDIILTAGDMITASEHPDYASSIALYKELLKIAPVYASYGNHEKRMAEDKQYRKGFFAYFKQLEKIGVRWLLNDSVKINSSVILSGLDIDRKYYKKINRIFYPPSQMKHDLASIPEECFNIVLAHNPRFFSTYAQSGADLFLAGHYHGGAVRIFGAKVGVVSPQFRMFPKYSRGLYEKTDTKMIVSAGCGSHKVNLRINNKPEVVVIKIHGNLV